MIKYFISSKIENVEQTRKLRDMLNALGYKQTYDWTIKGDMRDTNSGQLTLCAMDEINGVCDADVVIVLLPGGKGTHTELGIAIGQGKNILLWSEDGRHFEMTDDTTTFYWYPLITQLSGPLEKIPKFVQLLDMVP